MKSLRLPFLILIVFFLAACSGPSSISVLDAWARPALSDNNAAVYLQMYNGSENADVLISISVEFARAVEIHESSTMEMEAEGDELDGMIDSANSALATGDVMQMQPLDRLNIAAGQTVVFQPGGLHVMLIDLESNLALGDEFPLTMHFESGLSIELSVEVKNP